MRSSKRLGLAVAGLTALTLVAACGGGSSGGKTAADADDVTSIINGTLPEDGPAEAGGTLTTNDLSDAPSLDVQAQSSFATHGALSGIVYSKLLDYKTGRDIKYGTMGLQGDLAESWKMSDDGTSWTFNLRKGVKWQNIAPVSGREFTASDVVCTIQRSQTLAGAVAKNLVDIVDSMDTPDPYTVVFHLKTAFAGFDQSVASYNMEMLPCEGTRGDYNLAEQAIGTGPFILQKWDRKVQRTYVKNPDYFVAGKPHLDGINVLIMSDPAAVIAAYRTGQMDLTGSVTDQLLPSLTATNKDAVVRSQMQLTMNQVTFNQAVKPFDDIRVRKAIAMAWDRNAMGEANYGDFLLGGPYPSTLDGGVTPEEADKAYPHDVDAAKKLLADAGYPNGFDVEMLTTDGYGPTITNQAQWVQEDLKKIGVNVTLKIVDYSTYFAAFAKKAYSVSYGYASGLGSADEWLESFYLSTGPRNWFNINDPKLDQMIEDQRGILDPAQRTKALHDIGQYITENVANPILGMQYAGISVMQPWVHNVYGTPTYSRAWAADAWLDSKAPGRSK